MGSVRKSNKMVNNHLIYVPKRMEKLNFAEALRARPAQEVFCLPQETAVFRP
jgi:hypothetical protein